MTGIIDAMLTRSNQTLQVTTIAEAMREQTLRDCQRQLDNIGTLEDCLHYIGNDLKALCQRSSCSLEQIKPLQEKARVATSLIRGHIYIAEMRSTTGPAAWQALDNKLDVRQGDKSPPAPQSSSSTTREKGAPLARMKKNLPPVSVLKKS